jgi:hypothetical protein
MDSFDTVMDYVISSEIAAESISSNMNYQYKNYNKINKAIGRDTKKALTIIFD